MNEKLGERVADFVVYAFTVATISVLLTYKRPPLYMERNGTFHWTTRERTFGDEVRETGQAFARIVELATREGE